MDSGPNLSEFAKPLPLALRKEKRPNAGAKRKSMDEEMARNSATAKEKSKDEEKKKKKKRRSMPPSQSAVASSAVNSSPKPDPRQAADFVRGAKQKRPVSQMIRKLHPNHDHCCWVCHKQDGGALKSVYCGVCPRMYHVPCANLQRMEADWVCLECEKVTEAECTDTQSSAMANMSLGKIAKVIRCALDKARTLSAASFFSVPIDTTKTEFADYKEYIFYPMYLNKLEKMLQEMQFGSTEAFLAELKWIQHNAIVYFGSVSKQSHGAKAIIKLLETELGEIEACPDCYLANLTKHPGWFANVCARPHTLIWGKLQGFPFWPAKVMKEKDGLVEARFFGQHDRAWLPAHNCFLYSEKIPFPATKKRQQGLKNAINEVEQHIKNLKEEHDYQYAPHRTPFDPARLYTTGAVAVMPDGKLKSLTEANRNAMLKAKGLANGKDEGGKVETEVGKVVDNTSAAGTAIAEESSESKGGEKSTDAGEDESLEVDKVEEISVDVTNVKENLTAAEALVEKLIANGKVEQEIGGSKDLSQGKSEECSMEGIDSSVSSPTSLDIDVGYPAHTLKETLAPGEMTSKTSFSGGIGSKTVVPEELSQEAQKEEKDTELSFRVSRFEMEHCYTKGKDKESGEHLSASPGVPEGLGIGVHRGTDPKALEDLSTLDEMDDSPKTGMKRKLASSAFSNVPDKIKRSSTEDVTASVSSSALADGLQEKSVDDDSTSLQESLLQYEEGEEKEGTEEDKVEDEEVDEQEEEGLQDDVDSVKAESLSSQESLKGTHSASPSLVSSVKSLGEVMTEKLSQVPVPQSLKTEMENLGNLINDKLAEVLSNDSESQGTSDLGCKTGEGDSVEGSFDDSCDTPLMETEENSRDVDDEGEKINDDEEQMDVDHEDQAAKDDKDGHLKSDSNITQQIVPGLNAEKTEASSGSKAYFEQSHNLDSSIPTEIDPNVAGHVDGKNDNDNEESEMVGIDSASDRELQIDESGMEDQGKENGKETCSVDAEHAAPDSVAADVETVERVVAPEKGEENIKDLDGGKIDKESLQKSQIENQTAVGSRKGDSSAAPGGMPSSSEEPSGRKEEGMDAEAVSDKEMKGGEKVGPVEKGPVQDEKKVGVDGVKSGNDEKKVGKDGQDVGKDGVKDGPELWEGAPDAIKGQHKPEQKDPDYEKLIAKVVEDAVKSFKEMEEKVEDLSEEMKSMVLGLQREVIALKAKQELQQKELLQVNKLAAAEISQVMEYSREAKLSEMRKRFDKKRDTAVEHAKKKQWCANCLGEANYFCCWNTSYCNYKCQEEHWRKHERTCQQKSGNFPFMADPDFDPFKKKKKKKKKKKEKGFFFEDGENSESGDDPTWEPDFEELPTMLPQKTLPSDPNPFKVSKTLAATASTNPTAQIHKVWDRNLNKFIGMRVATSTQSWSQGPRPVAPRPAQTKVVQSTVKMPQVQSQMTASPGVLNAGMRPVSILGSRGISTPNPQSNVMYMAAPGIQISNSKLAPPGKVLMKPNTVRNVPYPNSAVPYRSPQMQAISTMNSAVPVANTVTVRNPTPVQNIVTVPVQNAASVRGTAPVKFQLPTGTQSLVQAIRQQLPQGYKYVLNLNANQQGVRAPQIQVVAPGVVNNSTPMTIIQGTSSASQIRMVPAVSNTSAIVPGVRNTQIRMVPPQAVLGGNSVPIIMNTAGNMQRMQGSVPKTSINSPVEAANLLRSVLMNTPSMVSTNSSGTSGTPLKSTGSQDVVITTSSTQNSTTSAPNSTVGGTAQDPSDTSSKTDQAPSGTMSGTTQTNNSTTHSAGTVTQEVGSDYPQSPYSEGALEIDETV